MLKSIIHLSAALLFMACTSAAYAAERVLLGTPAAKAAASARSTSPAASTINSLRAKAAKEGKVRVIIGYRVPFAPEGELSAKELSQQRQEIAAAGERLRRTYAGKGRSAGSTNKISTLSSIPFASMEVTDAELKRLLADPNVYTIDEDQPALPQLTYSAPLIGAPEAWKAGATGKGQVVAVIDFGTQTDHPFLRDPVTGKSKVLYEAKIEQECTPIPNSRLKNCVLVAKEGQGMAALPCPNNRCNEINTYHGTAAAGIIVGQRPASAPLKLMENNRLAFNPPFPAAGRKTGYELTGIAPDAELIVMRVFYYGEVVAALEKVYDLRKKYNIAVVSTSLGVVNSQPGPCDLTKPSMAAAVGNLRAAGILTVASAGNNSAHLAGITPNTWMGATDRLMIPACLSSAVSVGATFTGITTGKAEGGTLRSYSTYTCDHDLPSQLIKTDEVACYSDTSPQLTLLAPSTYTETAGRDGTYTLFFGGTSAAAPHVAGAIAVLRSAVPTATADEILGALRATGKPVRDYRTGLTTPRIDVARALEYLQAGNAQPVIAYTRAGEGSGKVSFVPSGSLAACSTSCSNAYAKGTRVTLTAEPDPGMRFTGWGNAAGVCRGTEPNCSFSVEGGITQVTASFAPVEAVKPSYTLSYSRSGTGSGTLSADINGKSSTCTGSCTTTQREGTVVTLTAQPASDASFSGWSGACTGTAPSCTVTLRSNASAVATFVPRPSNNNVTLSYLKTGSGSISASVDGTSTTCAASCTITRPAGTQVTLTARPGLGAIFAGWSGSCRGTAPTCTLNLRAGGVALATFQNRPRTTASNQ